MIELTDEQCRELEGPEPPRAHNARTNETYVLVRADLYERLRMLLDDELPDVSALVEEAMREYDRDDPSLESYQQYRHGEAG